MPAILALGLITSYEDIKEGKIRNKWVVLALIYASGVYSALLSYAYFSIGMNMQYLITLLTNILFVAAIGFGAWYFGIWTAGDGKLFVAFSALIPLSAYKVGYQNWIPSITLLINIFVPALAIMIILVLLRIKMGSMKKMLKSLLREVFQPKQFLISVVSLFAIFWATGFFLSLVGLSGEYILTLVLTMLVFSIIQKKLKNKAFYVLLIISLVRFIVDESVYSSSFLINFLILVFVWKLLKSFLRGTISKLGREVFTQEVKIKDLKPGMMLSETIQKKKKLTKQELDALKKMPDAKVVKHLGSYYIQMPKSLMGADDFLQEEAEGLTLKQIHKIKRAGIKKIRVSQTIPFAPFMFLGVLLTISGNGNILIVIKNLIL